RPGRTMASSVSTWTRRRPLPERPPSDRDAQSDGYAGAGSELDAEGALAGTGAALACGAAGGSVGGRRTGALGVNSSSRLVPDSSAEPLSSGACPERPVERDR